MNVGDENMVSGDNKAGKAFAGGVSSLKMKLMMAKAKDEEVNEDDEEDEEEEEEEEEVVEWVAAIEHPVYSKFFNMIDVVGEASVKTRMETMSFDSKILDKPGTMIGLKGTLYENKEVPKKLVMQYGGYGEEYEDNNDDEEDNQDEDYYDYGKEEEEEGGEEGGDKEVDLGTRTEKWEKDENGQVVKVRKQELSDVVRGSSNNFKIESCCNTI